MFCNSKDLCYVKLSNFPIRHRSKPLSNPKFVMNNLMKVRVGESAPDFSLSTAGRENWQLSRKIGRVVALLFYPGDETLVCTKQLCSVRDNWTKYLETGADIVGISPGTVETHLQFAEHHNLPLPLLSDTDREITKTYAKHLWMPIWATRGVIVVDAKGIVRYRNVMVRALRPSDDEVLAAINLAKYDALSANRKTILVG